MFPPLAAFDRYLLLLSQRHHAATADWLMWALSSRGAWAPLLVVVLSLLVCYGWRRVLPGTAVGLVGVLAANTVAGTWLKPWIARPRPCQEPELLPFLHLPHACSASFSFPSSHAADVAAVATVTLLVLPRRFRWLRLGVLLWSVAVAGSRVYLGAHYPSDVLAGIVLGSSCALATHALIRRGWPAAFA